jgi:glutamate-ammonia-ligase adenylyltransferase
LTRARVVAGDAALAADVEAFRHKVLARPRDRAEVVAQVADMRARIADAKTPAGVWDAKTGAGRMQDIELVAQAGALLAGSTDRSVAGGLQAAVSVGWIPANDAADLRHCHDLFWSVQTATRLMSDKLIETDNLGEGGAAFLCRSAGFDTIKDLQDGLEHAYAQAASLIATALDREVTS